MNKCSSQRYMLPSMSYPSGIWILKYINERVNKMVSFKSANKQRTTVKFHKIYQMNVFITWTANTNSCSIAFMLVLTVYSYNRTLTELLIIQSLYLEIKFHIYTSRCKTVCQTVINRLCSPQTNSNSSNQWENSYTR
jgi:hypothetical protein